MDDKKIKIVVAVKSRDVTEYFKQIKYHKIDAYPILYDCMLLS
jgi:hypothetical protein